jgi:hypothetical protein
MVRSRAHGAREDLAFMLGSEPYRCLSCGSRFLCFRRFRIPTAAHHGYVSSYSGDRAFMVAWFAISAGILSWLGIGFWILHRFHRWPF